MENHNKHHRAFEEIYCENRNLVYAYLDDYLSDAYLKDDISSVVWLKLFERFSSISDMEPNKFKAYLRATVRNATADYFRHEKREQEAIHARMKVAEQDTFELPFEESFFESSAEEYLDRACSILNDHEKDLLRMRFSNRMSARQTGEALGISEGNVRVQQTRIVHKLREEIERLGRMSEEKEKID